MITANRVHHLLNSALDWDDLIRRQRQARTRPSGPRVAFNDSGVCVEMDLPGVNRDALDVEVIKNSLTVKVQPGEQSLEDGQWRVRERPVNRESFELSFPFNIDAEKSELELANGVLKIWLHKPDTEAPRKLHVK